MERQRSLLCITPILPAAAGNGLAMRAGVFLDALARDFAVTLLVVPVAGASAVPAPRFVSRRVRRVVVAPLAQALDPLWDLGSRQRDPRARVDAAVAYPRPAPCRFATTPLLDAEVAALAGLRFDAVHVMRSYLAPYAAPFLAAGVFAGLDLDDDEAQTHARLAALAAACGMPDEARLAAAEAQKYRRHEAQWLPRFRLLSTCTAEHARRVATGFPDAAVAVVPNSIVVPRRPPRPRVPGRRILFVGNLSYLPNVAGIGEFAREVLPRLRVTLGDDVTLRIAGSAPVAAVAALAALPGVELVADPPAMGPHYARADLAVVPLAAGGGTRIKLLEALAHAVPVVATTVGAEGIDVLHGTHLLLADDATAFAAACARVLAEPALAARLAADGRRRVAREYAQPRAVERIRAAYALRRDA